MNELILFPNRTPNNRPVPIDREELIRVAQKRLPRTDKRALMDVPPGDRAKVQERWTLRQFIQDARDGYRLVKKLKREASRARNLGAPEK